MPECVNGECLNGQCSCETGYTGNDCSGVHPIKVYIAGMNIIIN